MKVHVNSFYSFTENLFVLNLDILITGYVESTNFSTRNIQFCATLKNGRFCFYTVEASEALSALKQGK